MNGLKPPRPFSKKESPNRELSKRENQVMECVLKGMPNKLIARKLFITESTIKFHCSNIYRKLDIANRAALILLMKGNFNEGVGFS